MATGAKLETNPDLLNQKMKAAMEKYSVDAVVGNILETRYDVVTIHSVMGTEIIRRSKGGKDIEHDLVSRLIGYHSQFMAAKCGSRQT